MKKPAANQFTHSHLVLDDSTVTFRCSSDVDLWPWLALDPFDPIVVQTVNYWASVETGEARGTFDPTKWSALTQSEWVCGESGCGHATHGVADVLGDKENPRFKLVFFDAAGALVYKMTGVGVVFENRDFESWRKDTKEKFAKLSAPGDFQYASADTVGVVTQKECFLSPVSEGDVPRAAALITKETGFMPIHPYHSGSGDHVNANHLADVARQFVNQLLGGADVRFVSGTMEFSRYVELDRLFDIELLEDDPSQNTISVKVEQADNVCATIKFGYQPL